MKTDDFDYELPQELIAQVPLQDRSSSRLMVLDRKTKQIAHKHFYDIVEELKAGDVLVLNDTKVIPARLIGTKEDTKATIEVLLLNDLQNDTWKCLTKPAKRVKIGTVIDFGNLLKATCVGVYDEGIREYKLTYDGVLMEILDKLGSMPLPPYIHQELKDKDRYQTVYAKNIGSAAAPTAGLHFTKDLLTKIKDKGVIITTVTLHVGLGTFRPVNVEDVRKHKMHSEYYVMSQKTADILNSAKQEKRRIIAVGTTSVRTLETVMQEYNEFKECCGNTDIFIYPGYKFKAIDALITNFHLPKSTLIMLVSAFADKDFILKSYQEAVKERYRFFSFGDAMFIK